MPDSKQVDQVWAALLTLQAEMGNPFTVAFGKIVERLPKDGPSEPTVKKILDEFVSQGKLAVRTTAPRAAKEFTLLGGGQNGNGPLQGVQTSFPGTATVNGSDPWEALRLTVRGILQHQRERSAQIAELEERKTAVIAELNGRMAELKEANDKDTARLQAFGGQLQTGEIQVEEPPADPDGQEKPEEPANTGEGDPDSANGGQQAQEPAQGQEDAGTQARTTAVRKARQAAAAA